MKLSTKIISIVALVVIIGLAFFLGKFYSGKNPTSSSQAKSDEKTVLYWVAPMNPKFRSDQPGKSPMGMDLVPVYAEPDQTGAIQISAAIENNIGIRTAKVGLQVVDKTIHAVGYVKPNDEATESVNSYSDGWIRDLQIKTSGEKVTAHQLLFKLYSPDIISAEEEYRLAMKYHNAALEKAGKKKLITLGVSLEEIEQLKTATAVHEQVSVYAPITGYVTALSIKEGQHITPNLSLMTIADLSQVWIIAEVYEKEAANLQLKQTVNARFPSLPGKVFKGQVDYIYPQLNAKSRTVKIRIVLENTNLQFKPDMYANITIDNTHSSKVLAVPKEALVRLGSTDRIILSLGKGRFRSVLVQTGMENGQWIQVTQGLKEGDIIVTSSQFLLDSESNLKAGLSQMENNNEKKAAVESKEKMPMEMAHQHT